MQDRFLIDALKARAQFWLECKKPLILTYQRLVVITLMNPLWISRSEYFLDCNIQGISNNSVWNDKEVIFFRYEALKTEFSWAK